MWQQHELGDGTYTMWDLVTINRVLDVRDENERRREEAIEKQRENQPKRRR